MPNQVSRSLAVALALLGIAACETPPPLEPVSVINCEERANMDYDPVAERAALDARIQQARTTLEAIGFTSVQEPLPGSHVRPVPLSLPSPIYPGCAVARASESRCLIAFDVSREGVPEDIKAVCDSAVFNRQARYAMSKARFQPATIDGVAVDYPGIVQPLRFLMAD